MPVDGLGLARFGHGRHLFFLPGMEVLTDTVTSLATFAPVGSRARTLGAMVDSFVDTPNLKKMGPRDGCGRALDTALDDMYMCSFAPVHGDDQSEAYVMIDKAIELMVDDAHIEKMDVASKD